MKRLFLFLFVVVGVANAQTSQFQLTPEGFVNSELSNQDYVVLEVPAQDQQTLYNKTLSYLHGIFRNPDAALSTVDGEMITVNGTQKNAIRRNSMHVFDINYTYTIRFKEGRLRVDAPGFKLTTYSNKPQELHLVWTGLSLGGDDLGIFGRKDKLKSKKAKEDLEAFFNTRFESLIGAVQNEPEDW